MSLNDYCARTMASPPGRAGAIRPAAEVVERAAGLVGEKLVGVAIYGSVARGDDATTSDVDVLVVVDRSVKLTRALYRRWDEAPVAWDERPVEPHFVHLPRPDEAPSGLWAEVALDGIVLFERGLELSRALIRVRHDVLTGRIVRRVAHGQPYWAEAS